MSFFALKTIALLSMLWDHVTYVWPLSMTLESLLYPEAGEPVLWITAIQRCTDYIGCIAAPIFLFSIANGYRHTRDLKRYALRLLVFACLAEYPYYLLFGFHGNIIFTLLLGLLTLRLMDWGNEKRAGLGYLLCAGVIISAEYLRLTEGGGRYILFILVFYWTEHWPTRRKALLWLAPVPVPADLDASLRAAVYLALAPHAVHQRPGPSAGGGVHLFLQREKRARFSGGQIPVVCLLPRPPAGAGAVLRRHIKIHSLRPSSPHHLQQNGLANSKKMCYNKGRSINILHK